MTNLKKVRELACAINDPEARAAQLALVAYLEEREAAPRDTTVTTITTETIKLPKYHNLTPELARELR